MKKSFLIAFILFLCITCNKGKDEQNAYLSVDTDTVLLKPGYDTVLVNVHSNTNWYFTDCDTFLEIGNGFNGYGCSWLSITPGTYQNDTVVEFVSRDSIGGHQISVYLRQGYRTTDTIFPDTNSLIKIVVKQEALKPKE